MKKLISCFVTLFCLILSSQTNAKDGLYVGTDLLISQAKYQIDNLYTNGLLPNQQKKIDGDYDIGVGASIGYKKSFNKVFIAPEVFYDYLNSSAKDYHHLVNTDTNNYSQDTLEIRSRYGAKANLGFNFTEKFAVYLTYGISSVDHVDNFPSVKDSKGKSHTSAIYGIGSTFNIGENWALKAEFNSQRFNTRYFYYQDRTTTQKIRLNVLKVGLNYSF